MAKKEEKKISIFGEAKVKSSGSKPKDDKEVVYIDGLESKLLELQFLKAQIADLEAQLVGVTDEIKTISKEKFVELYQSNRSNPNTFLIKDGEGCVMVIPTDRYISIKDEDRANQLIEEYGDDIITIDEKYYFNPQVLERNMSAIEKLIMDAKTISDDDKRNLLVKEVKYSISKGYIDKLAVYGNKIETVIDDIQPIITLKNCGGKMEEGGELESDFIATIYENGGGVQTFINSSDDISWLKENHLQDLEYENFNSAIIYGNEDSPEKIELFEKLEPLHTDTPTTFILKDDYSGYEKVFEKGGFLGGIFGGGRTYKKGLAYKLDRAKHNKSEDWEVPMKNRKKRYENGGGVNQNVRGKAYYITTESAGSDYDYLLDSVLSRREFDKFYDEGAILEFYFDVNIKYDWQLVQAIYEQMSERDNEEGYEEGRHIIGYKISISSNMQSNLPYDDEDEDEYANGGGVGFDWNKAMKIANKLKVIKDRLADARAKGNPELVKKLVEEHEYYGSQLDAMNAMRTNKMANGGGVGSKVRMRLQDEDGFDEYLEEINFNFNEIEFEDSDIIIVSKNIADKFENDGVAYVLMGNYANGGGIDETVIVYAENKDGHRKIISEHKSVNSAKNKIKKISNEVFNDSNIESIGTMGKIEFEKHYKDFTFSNGGGVDSWSKEIEVVALSQSGTRGYAVYDTMTNRRAINKDGSYEFDDGEISEIIGEKNMDAFYDGQDKFKPKKKLNFDIFANGGGVGKKSFYSEVKVGNKDGSSLIILGKTYDFITGEPNNEYQKIAAITEDGEIIYFLNSARRDSYSNNFIKGIAKNINKYDNGGGVGEGKKRRFKKIDLNKDEATIKDYVRMYALHPRSYFVYPKDGDFKNYVYIIEPFATVGFANGGGVEDYDYYGSMTDESVVMQNCSNGEIHCDILEEIIGSKPEYPYQQVGSIRLQKCYLRPYYKIS